MSSAEWLAAKVLEYSIIRRSSKPVEFIPLDQYDHLIPDRIKSFAATKFSFQRLTIPQAMDRKGMAAYVDSDMVCQGDIAQLFDATFSEGKSVALCPDWQTAVFVCDCEKTPWDMERFADDLVSGKRSYGQLLNFEPDFKEKEILLPQTANCHDRRKDFGDMIANREALLVHFTNMPSQPHLRAGHPYGHIWTDELNSALAEGFITRDQVLGEIELGHVRPSLSVHVGVFPPPSRDEDFVPPYKRLKR